MKLRQLLENSNDTSRPFPENGRNGYVYRGVTADEYQFIVNNNKIQTTGQYSHSSEGTSFTFDPPLAQDTVTFGRDNPVKTGKPVYVLEVQSNDDIAVDRRDYWPKSKMVGDQRVPISAKHITYVWRFNPDETITGGKFPL